MCIQNKWPLLFILIISGCEFTDPTRGIPTPAPYYEPESHIVEKYNSKDLPAKVVITGTVKSDVIRALPLVFVDTTGGQTVGCDEFINPKDLLSLKKGDKVKIHGSMRIEDKFLILSFCTLVSKQSK